MKTTIRTLTFSTNYVPSPPLPRKVGGGRHDPQAPMGAPPLLHNEATWELLAIGLTLKKCYCYPAGHVRACRRFQGTHTYDRIAKVGLLYDVNDELFNPDEHKIVATVTDNGANLVCRLI